MLEAVPDFLVSGARLRPIPGSHPIAPTKFPKRRSAVRLIWREAPSQGMACASQEEDTLDRSRTRRLPACAYPQVSCE